MTQLMTVQNAYNYLNVRQVQHFTDLFGGDTKKATSFLAVAIAQLQKNPKLLKCNDRSVRDSLIEAAQVDLVPGGAMQHAYLVPYGKECTLQIGYRGLAELCQRDGAVKKVWGNVVYRDEVDAGKFVVHSGSRHELIHDRDPFREDPPSWGELLEAGMVGAYACAELHTGAINFEVTGLDVLKRARAMSKSDAYDDWASQMVIKFPLKRLCKRLPKSSWLEKFAELEEKQREREVIQLKEAPPSAPEPTPRLELNGAIANAWGELNPDQRRRFDMDRELADYYDPVMTSDDEARKFLARIDAVLS